MSLTIAILDNTVEGRNRVVTATIGLDNNYISGGYTLTPSSFGLFAVPIFVEIDYPGCQWVQSTNKLMVRDSNGTEVAGGTNLSAILVNARLIGS